MTPNNNERKPIFWTCCPDAERLSCDTLDEAVEEYLDGMDQSFPITVEVTGYARMEVTDNPHYHRCLEQLLELLDEEYGDPEDGPDGPTKEMEEAEGVFVKIVLDNYTPWMCEPVCKETVNVREWIDANRPDWRAKEGCKNPEQRPGCGTLSAEGELVEAKRQIRVAMKILNHEWPEDWNPRSASDALSIGDLDTLERMLKIKE